MPRTPYQTKSGPKMAFTVHLPATLAAWVTELAQRTDATVGTTVAEVLDDYRTLWHLPPWARQLVDADYKALGIDRRNGLRYLLWLRCHELREKGVGTDRPRVAEVVAFADQATEPAGKKKR